MTPRTRLHNQGHIPVAPALRLARSAFLNLNLIRREPSWGFRNLKLLGEALVETRDLLADTYPRVPGILTVNHIGILEAQLEDEV